MAETTKESQQDPNVATPKIRETLRQDGGHWLVSSEGAAPARKRELGLVPALDKAIAIIEYLNASANPKVSLAEIATTLQISKSHCHAILKTLQGYDWLRFDDASKTYQLHSGMLASMSRLLSVPAIDILRREISAFVNLVHLPCVVSQPMADDSFMLIDKFHDPVRMEVSLPVGYRYPRDACVQMRAYLGWAGDDRLQRWMRDWQPVRYTAATPLKAAEIVEKVAETRRIGYARSVGEFTEGLMALGLPIFDRDGGVQYIVNCFGPIEDIQPVEAQIAGRMRMAVDNIHRQTLAKPPAAFGVQS